MDPVIIGEGFAEMTALGLCASSPESASAEDDRKRRVVEWVVEDVMSEFAIYVGFYGSENRPTCDHAAIVIRPLGRGIDESDISSSTLSFDPTETLHFIDIIRSRHNLRQLEVSYRVSTIRGKRFKYFIIISPLLCLRLRLLKYLAVHEPPKRYIPVWYDCLTFSVDYICLLLEKFPESQSESDRYRLQAFLHHHTMASGWLGSAERMVRMTHYYLPILRLCLVVLIAVVLSWISAPYILSVVG
jgi:hypothetical protein